MLTKEQEGSELLGSSIRMMKGLDSEFAIKDFEKVQHFNLLNGHSALNSLNVGMIKKNPLWKSQRIFSKVIFLFNNLLNAWNYKTYRKLIVTSPSLLIWMPGG
jgi:hypothetical protein